VFGPNGRLVGGFLPTHGFTAILIALVANLSIAGIAFVGLFFGGLASAALYLPIMDGLPSAAIDIVNAAIALFITAKSGWLDERLGFGSAQT
jgi:simple sugar transport system permease protein